jgi:hypothetical protein
MTVCDSLSMKKFRMFILVCQKFVCMCVCVFVSGHFCGLISQRIWMKLGTKLDDDAYTSKLVRIFRFVEFEELWPLTLVFLTTCLHKYGLYV